MKSKGGSGKLPPMFFEFSAEISYIMLLVDDAAKVTLGVTIFSAFLTALFYILSERLLDWLRHSQPKIKIDQKKVSLFVPSGQDIRLYSKTRLVNEREKNEAIEFLEGDFIRRDYELDKKIEGAERESRKISTIAKWSCLVLGMNSISLIYFIVIGTWEISSILVSFCLATIALLLSGYGLLRNATLKKKVSAARSDLNDLQRDLNLATSTLPPHTRISGRTMIWNLYLTDADIELDDIQKTINHIGFEVNREDVVATVFFGLFPTEEEVQKFLESSDVSVLDGFGVSNESAIQRNLIIQLMESAISQRRKDDNRPRTSRIRGTKR